MPSNWFFAIHCDTPDQEATNLMEHSASVLDISSDDDCITSRANDALERGKENIPPPEYTGGMSRRPRRSAHKGIKCPAKAAAYADKSPDAMVEDRIALREMDVTPFADHDGHETVEIVDVDEQPTTTTTTTQPAAQSVSFDIETEVIKQNTHTRSSSSSTRSTTLEPILIREDTPEKDLTAQVEAAI
jgi:hypothetical protein